MGKEIYGVLQEKQKKSANSLTKNEGTREKEIERNWSEEEKIEKERCEEKRNENESSEKEKKRNK